MAQTANSCLFIEFLVFFGGLEAVFEGFSVSEVLVSEFSVGGSSKTSCRNLASKSRNRYSYLSIEFSLSSY